MKWNEVEILRDFTENADSLYYISILLLQTTVTEVKNNRIKTASPVISPIIDCLIRLRKFVWTGLSYWFICRCSEKLLVFIYHFIKWFKESLIIGFISSLLWKVFWGCFEAFHRFFTYVGECLTIVYCSFSIDKTLHLCVFWIRSLVWPRSNIINMYSKRVLIDQNACFWWICTLFFHPGHFYSLDVDPGGW